MVIRIFGKYLEIVRQHNITRNDVHCGILNKRNYMTVLVKIRRIAVKWVFTLNAYNHINVSRFDYTATFSIQKIHGINYFNVVYFKAIL